MAIDDREAAAVSRAWVEAGAVLAQDSSARIVCPSCGRGVLIVSDETTSDGTRVERWMRCNACGNANTILLTLDQATRTTAANSIKQSSDEQKEHFDWTDRALVQDLAKQAVKSLRK